MMHDTLWDKIKYFYWHHWSHDWRPGQVYYRLKCLLFKRYSTIRARYLPHTWCDRRTLLPHMMFEILSDFIDKECSPGCVEWYGEYGAKIGDKYVRDIMQELYDWWHKSYNKAYQENTDLLWDEARKHEPDREFHPIKDTNFLEWRCEWDNEEDEKAYNICLQDIRSLERLMEEDLLKNMHRLVDVMLYMWT